MENGFDIDPQKLHSLKDEIVLIKYGGNAMTDPDLRTGVFDQIRTLKEKGVRPVLVHGGGPAIAALLEEVGVRSEFVAGHRRTDAHTMRYVEMALRGQVNGEIVAALNRLGVPAVGLSGKDAGMVRAVKRSHYVKDENGRESEVDLGFVGDVESVDPSLILSLLGEGYLPVIASVASGADGRDYNINADLFAGHLAGALKAFLFVAMTDVDGVRTDRDDPATRLARINVNDIPELAGRSIRGGMIPKIDACLVALEQGVREAHIIDGTSPGTLVRQLLTREAGGTVIGR